MNIHPHSKKIKIQRKITIGDYNQADIEKLMGDSNRPIGPYWIQGTRKAASGLTYEEQRVLMPLLVNCEPSDKDFRAKCEDYFHTISTKVPKDGVELEIGLEDGNDKPMFEKNEKGDLININLPLNPAQYVSYKHAYSHPQVSKAKGSYNNPLVKWYIEDEVIKHTEQKDLLNLKDEAIQLYLANKDSKSMIDMVLDLSSIKVKDKEKVIEFRKLSETKPAEFTRLVKDKDIKVKYMVSLAIKENILKRVGQSIVWTETGDSLGGGMDEVVINLKDKSKIMELNKIKVALKDKIEDDPKV